MKLGEALTLRATQAQRLNDLQGRIKASALVQEGDTPAEDCDALLGEYLKLSEEHSDLVGKIALANARNSAEGTTLTQLIQEREVLIRERNVKRMTARAGTSSEDRYRYMRSEVKFVATVDVRALHTSADELDERIRQINARLQAANWSTDL